MADPEHLQMLLQDVPGWNRWRLENPRVRPNLRYADLKWADLIEADLRLADLAEADLSGADLSQADLSGADLSGADLDEAVLHGARLTRTRLLDATVTRAYFDLVWAVGADFRRADISRSRFSYSNLDDADLRDADLTRTVVDGTRLWDTDLSGCHLSGTIFADVNLRFTKGLATARHSGPSTIGVDTLSFSRGQIPEVFLRGCGLSDRLIEYCHSLVSAEIEYHSCFISYSSRDHDFAVRLHADLQASNVRCWFAPEDLKTGARIRVAIDDAIRAHDKLLLILSQHSVDSHWVEQEVEAAMEQERTQHRLVLFPIRVDDAVMDSQSGWAAHLRRTRHIGDCRQWRDSDAYQEALQRLLRDLKST